MEENIPKIIIDTGFDFDYNEEDIWKLDYPIKYISIDELTWILDLPYWNDKKWYDLTPNEVINDPDKYPEHISRIESCDLTYPIDVMENKEGRLLILDGLHRLVKYKLNKVDTIPVRIIPTSEIENIRID